ncbi:MAG: hypothetical protein LEGION0398_MBIBDBAK_00985 [Legionellaceae bacterium]
MTTHFDIIPTLLTQVLTCKNPIHDYSLGTTLFNKKSRDYILISSYINYGIVERNQITTIYPTGNYKIEDLQGRELINKKLDYKKLFNVINDMKYFYQKDKLYENE